MLFESDDFVLMHRFVSLSNTYAKYPLFLSIVGRPIPSRSLASERLQVQRLSSQALVDLDLVEGKVK